MVLPAAGTMADGTAERADAAGATADEDDAATGTRNVTGLRSDLSLAAGTRKRTGLDDRVRRFQSRSIAAVRGNLERKQLTKNLFSFAIQLAPKATIS